MRPEDIKTITCKEYLEIFNIDNAECTTLDDLWNYTHMFTPMGNLIMCEDMGDESISAEYWDFSEEDFFGGAIEPNEDRDYVRIENRIFEIPKMD